VNGSVYIETSIFGHLTARPTDNLIVAANVKITQDWWNEHRLLFTLYASEIVEDEAAKGDPVIAAQRLNLLQSLMLLELTEEAFELSQAFLSNSAIASLVGWVDARKPNTLGNKIIVISIKIENINTRVHKGFIGLECIRLI
jgi:hypothetical protein